MILVIGATGFIGRSVTNRLNLMVREWQPYSGRVNSPQTLREQLEGVETVIHLAGSEWRGRNRMLQHVDVEGTTRILEECRRANVKNIIVLSRIGADHHARHALLQAKGEIERLVKQSQMPYTIIRSASAYGRGDRYFEMMVSLAAWSWPFAWLPSGGKMALQPIWVEDLARCIVETVDRPDLLGQTVTVAGDERVHYRDLVRMLLNTAVMPRIPVTLPSLSLRLLIPILYRWWYWPPVSQYVVDRYFVPEVTRLDAVWHHYGFHPARLADTIAYINQMNPHRRLFRR